MNAKLVICDHVKQHGEWSECDPAPCLQASGEPVMCVEWVQPSDNGETR